MAYSPVGETNESQVNKKAASELQTMVSAMKETRVHTERTSFKGWTEALFLRRLKFKNEKELANWGCG